jgi:bacterioferritin-associated ferredoxin
MYVCICNAVTDRDIRDAAHRGVCSMDALSEQLKVATCCGRCADCARQVLNQAVAECRFIQREQALSRA